MKDETFEMIKDCRKRRILWVNIYKQLNDVKQFPTVSALKICFGRELQKRGMILE